MSTSVEPRARARGSYEFRRVRVRDLTVDEAYQRPLVASHVAYLAREWDDAKAGVIEVSEREDGLLVVFDGQHRFRAADDAGEPEYLDAKVHSGLTPEGEADLWLALNRERRRPRPLEVFRAELAAGDERALGIEREVRAAGYVVGFAAFGIDHIEAVVSLRRITTTGGLELLRQTLGFIALLWSGEEAINRGEFLLGVSMYLRANDPYRNEEVVRRLRRVAPVVICRRARTRPEVFPGGGGVAMAIRRVLESTARGRGG